MIPRMQPTIQRRLLYCSVVLLFAYASAVLLFEDVRHMVLPNDLSFLWVPTKAFMAGKNPYNDTAEFEKIWADAGVGLSWGCPNYACMLDAFTMGYPPTALALATPLGLFGLRGAIFLYLLLSVSLFLWFLILLARKLPPTVDRGGKLFLVAFTLALVPLHSGIRNSNPNTLVMACLLAAVVWFKHRPGWAGIALAIGICIKPQLVFLFFAYPWLRKQWKIVAYEMAGLVAICAGTLLWLSLHHISWLPAYRQSLAHFSASGGPNSFDTAGSAKFRLINLQILIYQVTHNPRFTIVASGVIFLVMLAFATWFIYTRVSPATESIGFAVISVLTLVPVYQRLCSATILVFVIFWALGNWPRRSAKLVLLSALGMLVPFLSVTKSVGIVVAFVARHHLDCLVSCRGVAGASWPHATTPL